MTLFQGHSGWFLRSDRGQWPADPGPPGGPGRPCSVLWDPRILAKPGQDHPGCYPTVTPDQPGRVLMTGRHRPKMQERKCASALPRRKQELEPDPPEPRALFLHGERRGGRVDDVSGGSGSTRCTRGAWYHGYPWYHGTPSLTCLVQYRPALPASPVLLLLLLLLFNYRLSI